MSVVTPIGKHRAAISDRPDEPAKVARLAASFARSAERHDRLGTFPFANIDRLHEAGLIALTVPVARGGAGAGLARAAAVVGKLAEGEPSTALVLAMHYVQQAMIATSDRIPPQLADQLGRDSVASGALVNALRVEPDLGSPARGGLPATRAARTRQGWRLSGRKIYATGAPALTWYLVWAATDEAEPRVGNFLVPAGQAGTRVEVSWDHLGMRASGSHDVAFDDAEIPDGYAIDLRRPEEWRVEPSTWAWNTLLIAGLYDGVARAAAAWLLTFLHERRPSGLGAALAAVPRMQVAVGEIAGRLAVNERVLRDATRAVDGGDPPSVAELGLLKRAVTGNAVEAVEAALLCAGNHGLARKNPLERHYRDVLCGRVHTPQDDAVLLAAGRAALGIE